VVWSTGFLTVILVKFSGGLDKDPLATSHWLFPEVIYLTKGWIGFVCNSPEDATLLLSSLWVFGGSSIMLKWWRIAFNPDKDYFQFRHLWVLLPGLPLYLWNAGALRAIGDSLGKFIALDSKSLTAPVRKMGRVLVEMDIHMVYQKLLRLSGVGIGLLSHSTILGCPFDAIFVVEQGTSDVTVLGRLRMSPLKKKTYKGIHLSIWMKMFLWATKVSHQESMLPWNKRLLLLYLVSYKVYAHPFITLFPFGKRRL
jgi:hypothetical protein